MGGKRTMLVYAPLMATKRFLLFMSTLLAASAPSANAQQPTANTIPMYDHGVVYIVDTPGVIWEGIDRDRIRRIGPARSFGPDDRRASCYIPALQNAVPGNGQHIWADLRIGVILYRNDVEVFSLYLENPVLQAQGRSLGFINGLAATFSTDVTRSILACAAQG